MSIEQAMHWMRAHGRLLGFALVVLLQALVIVGLVVREERARATGREIVLQARPVDPRDLLRGDYVILGYQVQELQSWQSLTGVLVAGQEVDVVLRREGRYWVVNRYYGAGEAAGRIEPAEVFLRGTVVSTDSRGARIAYPNLERYYVPEGTGVLPKPADAVVVVDGAGTARIVRLEIDGKPWPPPAP